MVGDLRWNVDPRGQDHSVATDHDGLILGQHRVGVQSEHFPGHCLGDGVQVLDAEPDTFPRSYVEELRQENGKYRQRAQKTDTYAQRLHTELVRATGKLADATDMPFDEMHLDDSERLAAAIDDLLVRKPHLASRRPTVTSDKGRHSRQLPSTSLPYYGRERNNSRLANSLARQ